nr:hypothetical protein [Roseibium sp. Sym1]
MGGYDSLNETTFRGVLKIEIQTFDCGIPLIKLTAKPDMKLGVAGKAFQIIEDHDIGLVFLRVEIGEHRPHTGALHEIATT